MAGRGHLTSPTLRGLDRFAAELEKVEKPWGYELIWAKTERYAGKILFLRAGESLSLQFHNVKDEAGYVPSGGAEAAVPRRQGRGVVRALGARGARAGRAGGACAEHRDHQWRGSVPLPAGHGAPAN